MNVEEWWLLMHSIYEYIPCSLTNHGHAFAESFFALVIWYYKWVPLYPCAANTMGLTKCPLLFCTDNSLLAKVETFHDTSLILFSWFVFLQHSDVEKLERWSFVVDFLRSGKHERTNMSQNLGLTGFWPFSRLVSHSANWFLLWIYWCFNFKKLKYKISSRFWNTGHFLVASI